MHGDSLVVAIRYVPTVDIIGTKRVDICYSLHDSCGSFVSPWIRFCDNSGGPNGFIGALRLKNSREVILLVSSVVLFNYFYAKGTLVL